MEELAKKNLLDPKKALSQIDENVKLKTDLKVRRLLSIWNKYWKKDLKQEKAEIHRLMAKIQKICSEDNSEIIDQDENYEPLKIVNSLSAWISALKVSFSLIFKGLTIQTHLFRKGKTGSSKKKTNCNSKKPNWDLLRKNMRFISRKSSSKKLSSRLIGWKNS